MKKPGRESFNRSWFGIFIFFFISLDLASGKRAAHSDSAGSRVQRIALWPESAALGTALPSAALDPSPGLQGANLGQRKTMLLHTGTSMKSWSVST